MSSGCWHFGTSFDCSSAGDDIKNSTKMTGPRQRILRQCTTDAAKLLVVMGAMWIPL
jgi:hypothetical protein